MTTRRSLAGGAVLAMLGTSAATAAIDVGMPGIVPASPDAELIALCAQFDALEHQRQDACNAATTIEGDHAADLIFAEVRHQQAPILDRICAEPAITRAGMAALASSLTLWDRELRFDDNPDGTGSERLQAALLRSALAGRA